MKWILEGKVYDTEKAEYICEFKKPIDKTLRMFGMESIITDMKPAKLYKTKKGAWFSVANLGDKSRLILENEKSAKIIISSQHDVELYKKYFNDLEEA